MNYNKQGPTEIWIDAFDQGRAFSRDVSEDNPENPTIQYIRKDLYDKLLQDIEDMLNAKRTSFHRCTCGRMSENNIICPINQEGKSCKDGE